MAQKNTPKKWSTSGSPHRENFDRILPPVLFCNLFRFQLLLKLAATPSSTSQVSHSHSFNIGNMVVAAKDPNSRSRRQPQPGIPVIDLSLDRSLVSQLTVKTCEEFGFFKVINHGVPHGVSAQLEAAGVEFFNLPAAEKQQAGPPNPLGYGCRTIGLNGDIGDVEYLLLPADPSGLSQRARIILVM